MSNIIELNTDVMVLGAGPGGYAAAFRAADLGKKVILVEKNSTLGGVCLNVGCIPSKTLLHAAQVIEEAKHAAVYGITFSEPQIDINKLRNQKNSVIRRLTMGLAGLAKKRNVAVLTGVGKFLSDKQIEVALSNGDKNLVNFTNAIIAAGSSPVTLPFIPQDPRVLDSTSALEINSVPKKMLILGAGIIGLEMATVYHALGSQITVVELMNQIIPGADLDAVKPLHQIISKKYAKIMLETKVTQVESKEEGLLVHFEGKNAPAEPELFDAVLVAVGRKPNGHLISAKEIGVSVDERGFIPVNSKLQTNLNNIYAIGDIIGNPMLAHKAAFEGRLAAEIIAGSSRENTPQPIPSVAYTDPEIAWVGATENELKKQGITYGKGVFPWLASGRAASIGRQEGMTKLLFDNASKKLLGASIVGPNAGELISELALALQKGATASDIAHTIHPHPTLSESVMLAAEVFEGTITDL
ncbi:MAG: dihydrolipoyl dehydrogenase [Gammaproteobacteria bacterium]